MSVELHCQRAGSTTRCFRCHSGIVTIDSGLVTGHSGQGQKSVTTNQNRRSRSTGIPQKPPIQATEGTAPRAAHAPRASSSATRTTTSATAPRICSSRSMSGRARSLARCTGATAASIFRHFLATARRSTPARFDLHLVLDKPSIHKQDLDRPDCSESPQWRLVAGGPVSARRGHSPRENGALQG